MLPTATLNASPMFANLRGKLEKFMQKQERSSLKAIQTTAALDSGTNRSFNRTRRHGNAMAYPEEILLRDSQKILDDKPVLKERPVSETSQIGQQIEHQVGEAAVIQAARAA